MTEIVYRGGWPDDVKDIVDELLTPYARLLPGWCRILYVRFEANDSDSVATVKVCYDNRWASIRISPDWLEELPADRQRVILHEIAHIHVQPMRTVFVDLCEKGFEDQGFKDFAWERFKEAWEGSVEDLAWAFHSMASGK